MARILFGKYLTLTFLPICLQNSITRELPTVPPSRDALFLFVTENILFHTCVVLKTYDAIYSVVYVLESNAYCCAIISRWVTNQKIASRVDPGVCSAFLELIWQGDIRRKGPVAQAWRWRWCETNHWDTERGNEKLWMFNHFNTNLSYFILHHLTLS